MSEVVTLKMIENLENSIYKMNQVINFSDMFVKKSDRDSSIDNAIEEMSFIADNAPSPEDEAIRSAYKEELLRTIDRVLTKRYATLVKKNFGFVGRPKTYDELAKEEGVSRQMIQIIISKALSYLKKYIDEDTKDIIDKDEQRDELFKKHLDVKELYDFDINTAQEVKLSKLINDILGDGYRKRYRDIKDKNRVLHGFIIYAEKNLSEKELLVLEARRGMYGGSGTVLKRLLVNANITDVEAEQIEKDCIKKLRDEVIWETENA